MNITDIAAGRIHFRKRLFVTAALLAAVFCITGFWRESPTWEKIHAEIDEKFPEVPSISLAELKQAMAADTELILVDVRSRKEYAVSRLPKAIHLSSPNELAFPTNQFIVCYCSVGYRSAEFVQAARKLGYTNIVNYKGSIFEWANAGNPVYQDDEIVAKVHPYNAYWGQLLNQNLHYRQKE